MASNSFIIIFAALILASESWAGQAATSRPAFPVKVIQLVKTTGSSDEERMLATIGALPTRAMNEEEKNRAIQLMKPWVNRVMAPAYRPDWEKVGWKVTTDPAAGDIFVGDFRAADATIHLTDTSCYLCAEFSLPDVDVIPDGQEGAGWIRLVDKVCEHAQEIGNPSELDVWRLPKAVYFNPYSNRVSAKEKVGWRNMLKFKLARRYFSLTVLKLIDGEHPADNTYGIRVRLGDYADMVRHFKRDELLKCVKSANYLELKVLLENWNVDEATPAELCEGVVGHKDLDMRELPSDLQMLQQRASSTGAAMDLYDKLVSLSNDGRLGPPALLDTFRVLARDGDMADIRRSLGAVNNKETREHVLEEISK